MGNTATKNDPNGDQISRSTKISPEIIYYRNGLTCSACRMQFGNLSEQRDHFKTDFHRFNLKKKLVGKTTVTDDEFKDLMADKTKDSVTSDTDSETDEEQLSDESFDNQNDEQCHLMKYKDHKGQRQIPRVYFTLDQSKVYSIYRVLLSKKSDSTERSEELRSKLAGIFQEKCWVVLMLSAGHFAAAIFHRKEVIEHKAFHRYTVRAKRGTSQGVRDSKQHGHAPSNPLLCLKQDDFKITQTDERKIVKIVSKSAGASIRRHNESALLQDIQDLLSKWKDHLDHCSKIFVKWPVHYKSILFGGKSPPLDKADERIRKIPLMTGRPTFKEVKRVHTELSTIRFHETCTNDESSSKELLRTSSELSDMQTLVS